MAKIRHDWARLRPRPAQCRPSMGGPLLVVPLSRTVRSARGHHTGPNKHPVKEEGPGGGAIRPRSTPEEVRKASNKTQRCVPGCQGSINFPNQ